MAKFREFVDKRNEKIALDEVKKNEEKKEPVIDNAKKLKEYLNVE